MRRYCLAGGAGENAETEDLVTVSNRVRLRAQFQAQWALL